MKGISAKTAKRLLIALACVAVLGLINQAVLGIWVFVTVASFLLWVPLCLIGFWFLLLTAFPGIGKSFKKLLGRE